MTSQTRRLHRRQGLSLVACGLALLSVVGCGHQTPERGVAGATTAVAAPAVIAIDTPVAQRKSTPAQFAAQTTQVATNDQWSAFRGATGMGTSAAKGLPVTWSDTENIVWKVALPGPGASTPIVFGDRIYLTCYTGFFVPGESGGSPEDLKRHLLALRRTDGGVIWDSAVAAKLPEENSIRDHGFAANTPAIDDERIYAFFGKSGVFAFDHAGKQLWQADVGDKTHGWGTSASPVLYKDLVLINASVESTSLVALDRKTGAEKWRAGGIREAWNTPLVVTAKSGRVELIVATQGKVLAFDPDTGKELWSCKTDIGWYMVPSVVAHDGVVYCLGGRSGVAALAVRAGGDGDVTATHRLWTSMKGSNVSSPVFLDGHLYWMHEQRGTAYCAKAETGEVVYEERLERAGQVYASAVLADGKLYYLTRDGKTYVLAAKPEFEQLAVNDLNDRRTIFNGSPAVDGSRLLIRSDKMLYCIGK
ncbi:MAG: PQQ-binding-like beta-propeller repeat protein [Planctomycetaceae bacterium]|nr:PQQ-binding-like beta-propeller repeat protein [Planctomycetaceae bacterium]